MLVGHDRWSLLRGSPFSVSVVTQGVGEGHQGVHQVGEGALQLVADLVKVRVMDMTTGHDHGLLDRTRGKGSMKVSSLRWTWLGLRLWMGRYRIPIYGHMIMNYTHMWSYDPPTPNWTWLGLRLWMGRFPCRLSLAAQLKTIVHYTQYMPVMHLPCPACPEGDEI